jgi:hypothetical protein
MDELHGILMTYEMRKEKEKSIKERSSLQSLKEDKEQERESSDSSNNESDAEEAHFVRKIKKGSVNTKVSCPLNVLIVEK